MVLAKNRRHCEVRKNPEELNKLNQLHNDLCDSKELLEVPKISDQFENETNRQFNQSINIEYERDIKTAIPQILKRRTQRDETAKAKEDSLRRLVNEASFSTFRFSTRQRTAASPSGRKGAQYSLFNSHIEHTSNTIQQGSIDPFESV